MRYAILIGTDYRGCTFEMKQILKLQITQLDSSASFVEHYFPSEAPSYCIGCKRCFHDGEAYCPHRQEVQPIWEDLKACDVMILIYPTYVMREPGHLKALFDHLGVYWFSHRPEPLVFQKKAILITQSIGAPTRGALKGLANALTWMGVPEIHRVGLKLMEGVVWHELSEKRRKKIEQGLQKMAHQAVRPPIGHLRGTSKLYFKMCRALQHKLLKEHPDAPSLDTQYWLHQGWIGQS